MKARVKLTIIGLVQGVGYRYYCKRKAVEYDIKGYTKNLPDGSVEVDAEGESSFINEYIKDLKTGPMNASVRSVNIEKLPFENRYSDFKIL